jgi:hypothetical protein
MSEYTATAVCEVDNWVIDVPGIGTTHADRSPPFCGFGRMGPGNACAGVQR